MPSLQSNHGEDCNDEIRTIRVLGIIHREHNYLPMVNMTGALLSEGWRTKRCGMIRPRRRRLCYLTATRLADHRSQ